MSLRLLSPVVERGLIAIDKPAGLLVIPGREPGPSAQHILAEQLGRRIFVVHRIDRDTSGVVVFALDAESHRDASMAFERGEVHKRYVALVKGRIEGPLDLQYPLMEARKRRMKVAPEGQGKACRTLVRVRTAWRDATLVECEPLTGRQHQLRVHLQASGHPLLVDHQYGRKTPLTERDLGGSSDEPALTRTPLHAEWVSLPGFEATAPLPDDMRRTIAVLEGV